MKKSRFRKPLINVTSGSSETIESDDYMTILLPDAPKSIIDTTSVKPLGKKQILEIMFEKRLESMETPLPIQSKGYQMLSKLGYDGQSGLGKFNQGIKEPLRVDKRNRESTGLGIETLSKPLISKKMKSHLIETNLNENENSFRERSLQDFKIKTEKNNIKKAVRIISEIDERNSIPQHDLWPRDILNHSDDSLDEVDDVESDNDITLKLNKRLNYLRSTHFYCLYCGCQYESVEELNNQCPGENYDDH